MPGSKDSSSGWLEAFRLAASRPGSMRKAVSREVTNTARRDFWSPLSHTWSAWLLA